MAAARADGNRIAIHVRRLAFYLVLSFAVVSGGLTWWQVIDAPTLAARPDNPEVIAARRSMPRGAIFDAEGRLLASSRVVNGISRRTYVDPAFTHVIGYSSLRFAPPAWSTWDEIRSGLPRNAHDLVNYPRPSPPPAPDVTSQACRTSPRRSGADAGPSWPSTHEAVPCGMTSTPPSTPRDLRRPDTAAQALERIKAQPGKALVARDRQGPTRPAHHEGDHHAARWTTGDHAAPLSRQRARRRRASGDGFRVLETI